MKYWVGISLAISASIIAIAFLANEVLEVPLAAQAEAMVS